MLSTLLYVPYARTSTMGKFYKDCYGCEIFYYITRCTYLKDIT